MQTPFYKSFNLFLFDLKRCCDATQRLRGGRRQSAARKNQGRVAMPVAHRPAIGAYGSTVIDRCTARRKRRSVCRADR